MNRTRPPSSPGPKLAPGLNPYVVMVGALILMGIIIVSLLSLLSRALEKTEVGVDLSRLSDIVAPFEDIEPTKGPIAVPTAEALKNSTGNVGLVRGYVVFGARTVEIRRAVAQLSREQNKIALLLYGEEIPSRPTMSFVFELTSNSERCDESSLVRSRIIIDLPFGPGGKEFTSRLTRTAATTGEFPEIERFSCSRSGNGALEITIVGTDDGAPPRVGWALRYEASLTIPLPKLR